MKAKTAKILIVDDSTFNIKILSVYMKEEGYHIITAVNGNDALSLIECEKPDLVLLDIILPDISGYDVCKQIKADPCFKHIPVIFLTSLSDREDIVNGFAAGGVDYILKPYFPEELKARVKTQIELKEAYEEILRLKGIIPICNACSSEKEEAE